MWGRKRAQTDAIAETIVAADGCYTALSELKDILENELRAAEALLDQGDGLPSDAVREQTTSGWSTLRDLESHFDDFQNLRDRIITVGSKNPEAVADDLELLVETADGMAEVSENIAGLAESVQGMRIKLERVREDLVPIRERIHTAYDSTLKSLAAAPPSAAGRFALEARLGAFGDRLRALDEGRVTPTAERKVTDHYRDAEADLAALREELLALG
ncbi:hypothetical protein [Streptomyces sp. NBC_01465]|uniref:hypothetical protein n=1 Tax=Streptomyces sp. NBC_01465 TaxID=2903878 RepID=UPI002E2F4E0F|nr:hypothetical protein [Streptomyces sp. NBC_01465]